LTSKEQKIKTVTGKGIRSSSKGSLPKTNAAPKLTDYEFEMEDGLRFSLPINRVKGTVGKDKTARLTFDGPNVVQLEILDADSKRATDSESKK
jgi:hypothetical protein